MLVRDLEHTVQTEAFYWGNNATETYFEPAERGMDYQWPYVQRFLAPYPIDYSDTMELSCGHGRNSEKLAVSAKNMTLIDVNPENISFCKQRFRDKPWRILLNNGFDIQEVEDDSITFGYCFEAAVHFDLEIILSYIKEFRRVLVSGGFGFMHHSNYTRSPGADITTTPHARSFMSKEIFAHLCIHNGLRIVDQRLIDWGSPEEYFETDCFSLFQK
jgi:ubiquinone/menaquinone biosynthesis C-methylase UbiE